MNGDSNFKPEIGQIIFGTGSFQNFEEDRNLLNEVFESFCENFENYVGGDILHWFDKYENDIFLIRPYSWNDCLCEEENDECDVCGANFIFKPKQFKLSWYKYPFRSPSVNMELSKEDYIKMLEQCIESMK